MKTHLLGLAVALSIAALSGTAQTVTTLQQIGDSAIFVDIVFTGDGYRAAESAKFASDVQNAVALMFAEEPYREYQHYFNIHRVDVASTQSGADHPELNPPVFKNTAFDATYNCAGIERLICIDTTKVTQAISALAANQRDIVIVIVNDNVFGGSGGAIAVASTHSDSTEILLHEVGHSFGLLADEYGGPPPPACVDNVEPLEANATKTALRTGKWGAWIEPATPIPTFTTQNGIPGMYPDARYCDATLYRPTSNSKMRSLGRPFEQINTEALVKRIYNFISPIISSSPSGSAVHITGTQVFSVTTPSPLTHNLSVTWTLDGSVLGGGLTISLDAATLGPTAHTLTATVTDVTLIVRSDPDNLLQETVSWTVTGSAPALSISKTHNGNVTQGGIATYTVTVSNQVGAGSTSATVTVTDTLPSGLTLRSMSGIGWSCASLSCSRSDALAAGTSYPVIAVSVDVAPNAPSLVINEVSVLGGGSAGANASDNTTILPMNSGMRSDFNGDGHSDVIWQDPSSGAAQVWFLGGVQGTSVLGTANLTASNTWRIVGTSDFNQDGRSDLVWQNPGSGAAQVWFLGGAQGAVVAGTVVLSTGNPWRIRSIDDFNSDGKPDLIWQDPVSGTAQIWFLGGALGNIVTGVVNLTAGNSWRIVGTGDFNGDTRPDVLWQDPVSGAAQVWYLGGAQGNVVNSAATLNGSNSWRIAAVTDFNGDGHPDVVWQDPVAGMSQVWFLGGTQGTTIAGTALFSGANLWRIAGPH